MRGGVSSFVCLAYLAAGGCAATQTADVKIRPIPDASAKLRPGSTLADANAQLALNNVGLAIEGFRKALRENPNSPEAYSGLARAYEAMGRADLARTNYEAALALTPKDPQLLTAVAEALDQQGKADAAAMARQEAAAIAASRITPIAPQKDAPEVRLPAPALSSTVTVELPPARPAKALSASRPSVAPIVLTQVQEAQARPVPVALSAPAVAVHVPTPALTSTVTVTLPPARPAKRLDVGSTAIASMGLPAIPRPVDEPSKLALAPMPANRAPSLQPEMRIPAPALSSTVTVSLPPATPAARLDVSHAAITVALPPLREPAEGQSRPLMRAVLPVQRGPYLERLTPGEVALVTTGRPAWRTQLVAQTRTSTTLRWVPIMTAQAHPNIRILNAAQRQGVAAQTRTVLLDRGWRKIEIGNTNQVRERSVVLYPKARRTLGRSLAAQFGFRAQVAEGSNVLVVLLGRDAPRAKRG